MDKRKEQATEEVKQKIEVTLQDRRRILDLLNEINNQEISIKLQEEHILDMTIQLNSGDIRQRDKFGNLFDKRDLPRTIKIYSMDLERMKLQLNYLKEDLFYKVHNQDLDVLKKQINGHYLMVNDEYAKIKEALKGEICLV